MRFVLTSYDPEYVESPPFDGAYRVDRTHIDRRTVDDPAKVPEEAGKRDWWYGSGSNHRVENGMICRDMGDDNLWCIDFNTLEELAAFIQKNGECGISFWYGDWQLDVNPER